jgi:DNA-binding winged helix-turn-helix (wHTH) protein
MAVKNKVRPYLAPIPSNPSRELSDPRSMKPGQLSVKPEPRRAREGRSITLIVEHQTGVHVASHQFPVGSRIVMLPVLVIGPDDPHEVLFEHEDSAQLESVSASRQGGVKASVNATERLTVARSKQTRYVYGSLVLDSSRHEVHTNGHEIVLTHKEFGLLEYFLRNPGHVLSRDVLLNAVWGYDYYGTTRTVDVHVRMLKRKIRLLEPAIICIRSLGYKLHESLESVF